MPRNDKLNLRIDLSAKDNTKTAFASAAAGLRRFRDVATKTAKALTRVFAVGVGAGVVGATLALRTFIREGERIDRITKAAERLGGSTESLSALGFAAEQNGIAFNQLELSLQRSTRRIAEAAQGTGEAKKAIAELGLDAKALAQVPLEEQFAQLAGAFAKVEGASDRLRLAFKLFDSEGVKVLQLFDDGEEGIRKLTEEARDLGLVFNEFEAGRVVQALDALNRLQRAFTGAFRQLTISLAPKLEILFASIADRVKSARQSAIGLSDATENAQRDAEAFAIGFLRAEQAVRAISGSVLLVISLIREGINALADGVKFVADSILDFTGQLKQAIKLSDLLGIESFSKDMLEVLAKIEPAATRVRDLAKETGEAFGPAASEAFEEFNRQFREVGEINKAIEQLQRATANAAGGGTIAPAGADPGSSSADPFNDSRQALTSFEQDVQGSLEGAFRSATRALVDGLREGKDIAKELTNVLLEAAINFGINAISGGFGSVVTNFLASAKGNVFQGGEVKAFASGGVINSPVAFPLKSGVGIAGEAGPEAILPLDRDARGRLGVVSSGSASPVVFNISAVDARSFASYFNEPETQRAMSTALGRVRRRGGLV